MRLGLIQARRLLLAICLVIGIAMLGALLVAKGIVSRGDIPYETSWDSIDDQSIPSDFTFLTLIDDSAPVRVERFVLTSWQEWTSEEPTIGVWVDAEEVPMDRGLRRINLSAVDVERYASNLNELIDQWGEEETSWREAQFSVESGPVNSLVLVYHDGDRQRYTWRVFEGRLEPLRVERLDRGEFIADGVQFFIVSAVVLLMLLLLAVGVAALGVVQWRVKKAARSQSS